MRALLLLHLKNTSFSPWKRKRKQSVFPQIITNLTQITSSENRANTVAYSLKILAL